MRILYFLLAIACLAVSVYAYAADQMYISVDVANIRDAPNGSIIEKYRRGMVVHVYAHSGKWARISEEEKEQRWVHDSLLCATPDCWTATQSQPVHRNVVPRSQPAPRPKYKSNASCPCSSGRVCIGPRGGRYCITSGGKKRYGV